MSGRADANRERTHRPAFKIIEIPRLEDSLIGTDAVVSRSKRKPRAVRLMVGDHCQIDIE